MRNPRRTPIVNCEIDAGDLRQPHGAHLPVRRVVCRGVIVTVAHVMKSEFIAINVCPRQLRHIGLPIPIVARPECYPPAKHATEKQCNNGYFAPEVSDEYERDRNRYRQQSSYNLVCIAEWSVIPHGAKRPNGSNDEYKEDKRLTDPPHDPHEILRYAHNESSVQLITRSTIHERR